MIHEIKVIEGKWSDRNDVKFAGSVIFSKNDKILAESLNSVRVVLDERPSDSDNVYVEIDCEGEFMLIEIPIRGFQSLSARSTVKVKKATATARDAQLRKDLEKYQNLDKQATASCCGNSA